jgi:DNA-binding CsgD family transcriptional regulator
MLATSAMATGRPELAVEHAVAAIPLVAARDFVGGLHSSTRAVLAVALAQLGRRDEAERELEAIPAEWHADPRTAASMLHARAWLDLDATGERFATAANRALDAGLVASALPIAHDAVRLGRAEVVAPLLDQIAEAAPASIAGCFRAHAEAVQRGDPDELVDVSREFERSGLLVFAAEARAAAARVVAGRDARRGRWLVAEARELLRSAGTTVSVAPELQRVDGAETLTARQLEIARLAAARWRSREIADQLGVSTRTVDNLLGRVYRVLGVSGRDELAAVLDGLGGATE